MPEFRQNLATKEWVIVSPERGKRPSDFTKEKTEKEPIPPFDENCPFCPGKEKNTPPEVYRYPDGGDWQVRVVPNKFAALRPDLATTRTRIGLFMGAKGFGIAEVVIESPQHDRHPALMNIEEVAQFIRAYRERYMVISKKGDINLVNIFRNHGIKAGTSLEHPHSQIIATPIVPPHVRYPLEQALQHYDDTGRCVYCEMVEEELKQKERLIIDADHFIAFCPYAARTPFETRIYPKRHMSVFSDISDYEIEELAWVLRNTLLKLHICLGNPDYNYVIRSAPVGEEYARYLHWYMVIIPKISTQAGFEIGTGIYINVVPPEDSARYLRDTRTDG
jgi:UDPglucose--hexose-1-phosphate uridylyltransferase